MPVLAKIRKPQNRARTGIYLGTPKMAKNVQMSTFRISRNGCLGAKRLPERTGQSWDSKQKPQSHRMAKLSEEVRNHKPCESRVAQHYGPAQVEERKKGRAGDACF